MRQKLVDNFTTDNIWAMKHTRGGIVDAEFICQYLLLKHANKQPEILSKNMLNQILELTKAGILTEITGQRLYNACHLLQSIQAMLRLCLGTTSKRNERSDALLKSIAELIKCNADEIEGLILEKQKFIYDLYVETIENPASQMITPQSTSPLDNNRT
jgi:glutamate-ammonia-ligase adenylyltransferase